MMGRSLCLLAFLMIACNQQSKHIDVSDLKQQQDSLYLKDEMDSREESRDRTIWQKPYEVIHMLGSLDGKTIADIGAGSGYFSFRFIYEAAHVIAIDIEPELIQLMNQERKFYKQELQDKFEARLATPDDPKLNQNEVDIIFISNTYKYIPNRVAYLKNLIGKFKSGGRIMIVDFKKKITPIGPTQKNRMAQSEVEQELIDAGFKLILSDDLKLEYQYIVIAVPE